jgi:phosphatidyl-myo-inositol dimannoside synthase
MWRTAMKHRLFPGKFLTSLVAFSSMIPSLSNASAVLASLPQRLRRRTSSGWFVAQIDGLRFIAIGTVLLVHIVAYTVGMNPHQAPAWFEENYEHLSRGVLLFFVISGFVIAIPFVKRRLQVQGSVPLSEYFVRRLTRLEPPFLVAMLMTYASLVLVHHASARALLPHLLATCTYTHAMIYGTKSPIAFITWSLEIEVQFYLVAPLMMMAGALRRWARRVVWTGMAVVSIVVHPWIRSWQPILASSLVGYLPCFIAGIMVCDLALEKDLWRDRRSGQWDLIGGLALVTAFGLPASRGQEVAILSVMFGVCMVAALRGAVLSRILSLPWVTVTGGMCYSIYLLHVPLIYLFGHATRYLAFGDGLWRNLAVNLLVIPLPTLIACALFFLVIEKPCMKKNWPHDLTTYLFQRRAARRDQRLDAAGSADRCEVVLFAFEFPPVSGGISRLGAAIAKGLKLDGINVSVLTQEPTASSNSGLRVTRVRAGRPLREWQAFLWLRNRSAKNASPAAPIVCGIWYPEGLIAYAARVRPLVILAHGAELLPHTSRWLRPLWNGLQRRVLEKADLVIANSEYTGKLVREVAPRANVETIPLAVDIQRFAPGDKDAAKAKLGLTCTRVVCTVSRIHRYKGHETVLRAIARLAPQERAAIRYVIVGEGPYENELRKKVRELGIDANVRWLGFVGEDELADVYRASDLFVLCTREARDERAVEGFGLVFLEAQACGIPVAGTRTGGIPDAIREGEGAWLTEEDDTDQLALLMRKLVTTPEVFPAAGAEARERVVRDFTWKRYGQRFSAALKRAGINTTSDGAQSNGEGQQGVTVVVPTLNRGSYLMNTISDLLAQDHRPLEILLVDQSTQDDPDLLELVRERCDLISYHRVSFRGLPLARNYGWQRAKYDAVVFVDDDIRCGRSLIGEHLRVLEGENVGMVAGGTEERHSAARRGVTPGRFNAWTATPLRDFAASGEWEVQHVPGSNFSAWRSALRAAGGFDEALGMGAALYEETELCLRVRECGFKICFNGAARAQHLAAADGGCRIPDLPKYMGSLAHNRAVLIGRHLRWFQVPVAYMRLLLLFASYARYYRTMSIFRPGLAGLVQGAQAAGRSPVCSHFGEQVQA